MNFSIKNLEQGLEIRPYITHPLHEFLNADSGRKEGPNIGANGEHLTITFLSLNRSKLSIRLCRSIAEHIPQFKGEVLAIDNGSRPNEIEALRCCLEEMPFRWRIVELGQNYGPAGGRNRAMPHVHTEWVMSLDNDVYFIKNPLPEVQRDISILGCHFLSMCVLNEDATTNFIRGGHIRLSFDMNEFAIDCGSAYLPSFTEQEGLGFLATLLHGCASVLRKDTFIALGGYDEELFAWEDCEFSLRLFRAGLKVGANDVPTLVHNHSTAGNKDYEQTRFKRSQLIAAASHFEKKHGYKVWTKQVDDWVGHRERTLEFDIIGGNSDCHKEILLSPKQYSTKPRVALIVDSIGWALENVALQIIKHLSDSFDFDLLISGNVERPMLLLEMTKDHDLVHFLWRGPLLILNELLEREKVHSLYGNWGNFVSRAISPRPITFTVCEHCYLTQAEIEHYTPVFTQLSNGYTVTSQNLWQIYQDISCYPDPYLETTDGVDLELFQPSNLERFTQNSSRPLRIGWSGNSMWNGSPIGLLRDPKGFHTILRPALDLLKLRGIDVEECFADREVKQIPHYRMPHYYNSLDILICCSEVEGTPLPVLEAMACGVPIISTNVGIVSQAFGPQQKNFILKERNPIALADAIEQLVRNKHLLLTLSQENQQSIKPWDWSIRAKAYKPFFQHHIRQRSNLCS